MTTPSTGELILMPEVDASSVETPRSPVAGLLQIRPELQPRKIDADSNQCDDNQKDDPRRQQLPLEYALAVVVSFRAVVVVGLEGGLHRG